jgi:hypothetical protein
MPSACGISRLHEATFDTAVLSGSALTLVHFVRRESDCSRCDLESCQLGVQCFCVAGETDPGLIARYSIGEYPTILLFCGGRVVRRLIGRPIPGQVQTILRSEGHRFREGR